jgi:hypothetical protein
MHDPLGIDALIERKRQEIDSFTQPEDVWQIWHSHPITKHLLSTLQMELYNQKEYGAPATHPEVIDLLERYLSFGEGVNQ